MTDDERYAKDLICAGQCFRANGDLQIAYHRPKGQILVLVWGFRDGVKVLVDSWVVQQEKGSE